jgi:FAD/FMN-containing dehydrogenase
MANPADLKASLLASGFSGDLVIPSDPDYEDSLVRWARNARRKAALVAFVKSAEDVSKAIKLATSQQPAIPLTARSGGHSTSGGSSVENGIVVDLSRYVNGVHVDGPKKLAYVGGGANWEAVDKAAIKHGLASVGGTVNHTGVGG